MSYIQTNPLPHVFPLLFPALPGCDLLSVYKGLLRVFPLDENLWAKWCVRALDLNVGTDLISPIVTLNLAGVVGWLVKLKLEHGFEVKEEGGWVKQDGVLATKKEAEKVRGREGGKGGRNERHSDSIISTTHITNNLLLLSLRS